MYLHKYPGRPGIQTYRLLILLFISLASILLSRSAYSVVQAKPITDTPLYLHVALAPTVPSNLVRTTPESDNTPTFTWTAVIGVASYEARMDSSAWSNIGNVTTHTWPIALSDGAHTFEVRAVADNGNTGPAASFSFNVNTATAEVVAVVVSSTAAQAAEILSSLATNSAADAATKQAAAIIEAVDTAKAVEIFKNIATTSATSVNSQKAGAIIENVTTAKAVDILKNLAITSPAATESKQTGAIIQNLSDAKAASVLENLADNKKAGAAMDNVATAKLTPVVQAMNTASLIAKLPEMSASKLYDIPKGVLFNKLGSLVPTEQLTGEVPPTPPADLSTPVVVYTLPNQSKYLAIKTSAGQWVLLAATPYPLTKIMMKTKKVMTNVDTTIDTSNMTTNPRPGNNPPGKLGSAFYFKIDLTNANVADIESTHIGFKVLKTWISTNNLHKWSITLSRFDTTANAWVALPTKRASPLDEDDTYVYFTATSPGFSDFAINGDTNPPAPEYTVANLTVNPTTAEQGQDVTVSTVLTRTDTTSTKTYAVPIWVDDTVDNTISVTLIAGTSTANLNYTVYRTTTGSHSLRVDQKTSSFTVVAATIPTTPTNLILTSAATAATPSFAWTASTDSPAGIDYYQARIDSGSWSNIGNVTTYTWPTSLTDGSHTFEVKAVDKAGNVSYAASLTFSVDTTPPILGAPVLTSVGNVNKPVFTWMAIDSVSGIDHYEAQIDSGGWSNIGNVTSYTWPVALGDGSHIFSLRVTDKAGNTGGTQNLSFIVDTIAPTAVSNLARTTPDDDYTPTFTWTAAVDTGTGIKFYRAKIDNQFPNTIPYSPTGGPPGTTYTVSSSIGSGPHSFEVKAMDWAGNEGPAISITFTLATPSKPLDVNLVSHNTPKNMAPGVVWNVTITLTNTGSQTWIKGGVNPVYISYHWYDANWQPFAWGTGMKTAYWSDIITGQSVTIEASLKAPTTPGTYNLVWDMVQEGVTWFSAQGAPLIYVSNITVATSKELSVQWLSHSTPSNMKPGEIVNVPITITNIGSMTWTKSGVNPVYISYHWYKANWQPYSWGVGIRSELPQDVGTGQTVTVNALLKAPPAGTYNLVWDIVQEGITWFSAQSAAIKYVSNISVAASKPRDVQWVSHSTPSSIKPGEVVTVPVTLTNTGSLTWLKSGTNPVYVTYHWYNSNWQSYSWGAGLRTELPQDVENGQSVSLSAALKAPSTVGSYNLIWDVVQEGVAWFSAGGAPLGVASGITVAATQARDVQWTSLSMPTNIKPGQIVSVPITLTNTGSQTWSNSGANPVYISYHWYNSSWQAVEWGIGMWSALPGDVTTGQPVSINASLKAPSAPGSYNILWDVVQQGVGFFSGAGAPLGVASGITVATTQAKDVQWSSLGTPSNIKPGQIVSVPITLTNTGSQTWSNSGANPVYISYHWYNSSWQPVAWGTGMWSALPGDVASGQSVTLTAALKAPSASDSYNLLWDVVQLGAGFFSGAGAPLGVASGITVAATQSRDVQWVSHSTPTSINAGQIAGVPIILTNTGSQTWLKSGANPVYVTYHWYNSSWQAVEWGIGMWSALPGDVVTGQSVSITAALKAPSTPGSYNLLWDMVQQNITWFSGVGAPLLPVSGITVN